MGKRFSRFLRWASWILLTIILLPIISVIMMRLTGSMKMRKPDDQILGMLHSFPIEKNIQTVSIGDRNITYLKTSKGNKKKKNAILFVHGSPGSLDAYLDYMYNDSLLSKADLISYDRPGYGHSDFGKSLTSLRGQARILRSLMNELNYDH